MNGKRLAKIGVWTATICGLIILIPAAVVWLNGWTVVCSEPPRYRSFIAPYKLDECQPVGNTDAETASAPCQFSTQRHVQIGYLEIITGNGGEHTREEIDASERHT